MVVNGFCEFVTVVEGIEERKKKKNLEKYLRAGRRIYRIKFDFSVAVYFISIAVLQFGLMKLVLVLCVGAVVFITWLLPSACGSSSSFVVLA